MEVNCVYIIRNFFSTTVYFYFTGFFWKKPGLRGTAIFHQKKKIPGYARLPAENLKYPSDI